MCVSVYFQTTKHKDQSFHLYFEHMSKHTNNNNDKKNQTSSYYIYLFFVMQKK